MVMKVCPVRAGKLWVANHHAPPLVAFPNQGLSRYKHARQSVGLQDWQGFPCECTTPPLNLLQTASLCRRKG